MHWCTHKHQVFCTHNHIYHLCVKVSSSPAATFLKKSQQHKWRLNMSRSTSLSLTHQITVHFPLCECLSLETSYLIYSVGLERAARCPPTHTHSTRTHTHLHLNFPAHSDAYESLSPLHSTILVHTWDEYNTWVMKI